MSEPEPTVPPPPPARRNVRVASFRELFGDLPENIQNQARETFRLFINNPSHPSLHHKLLKNNARGSHRDDTWSVRVNLQYRALYVVVDGVNVWYWIGTKAHHERFTGVRK